MGTNGDIPYFPLRPFLHTIHYINPTLLYIMYMNDIPMSNRISIEDESYLIKKMKKKNYNDISI